MSKGLYTLMFPLISFEINCIICWSCELAAYKIDRPTVPCLRSQWNPELSFTEDFEISAAVLENKANQKFILHVNYSHTGFLLVFVCFWVFLNLIFSVIHTYFSGLIVIVLK